MTSSTHRLGALAAVMWLLLSGLTTPVAASGAGNEAVTAGNVVYQTDSGLEVTDATGSDLASGNPFVDRYTLALSGLTLSAAGNAPAAVTVDQQTGTETRLSGIDTSSTDVTVDPDDKQSVTIGGGLLTLDYRDPTFEVAGVDTDFEYEADSTASLTYPDSGLADGTAIEAIETSNGTVLDTATADPSELLGFTALPSGTYTVNASETDTEVPVAATGADVTVDEDTSVGFDASGSSDDGSIEGYEWDWTGDGTYEESGQTASHTYADPGTYTATLRVTDGAGRSDSDTRTVTVRDTTPPTATTGNDITVDEDTSVAFDASGSTDNGNIVSYDWDWTGDGTYEGSGQTASHSYADPGTYTATLQVTDGGGNTDTATVTISVTETTTSTADFGVEITDVNSSVRAGEDITVDYTVENTGDATGTQNVVFSVEGTQEAVDTDVTLAVGDAKTGTFRYTTEAGDRPSVEVAVESETDTTTRSVSVTAPPSPPNVTVAITGTSAPVTAGETLSVTASMTNVGDRADTQTVTLDAPNGTAVDTQSVTLDAGQGTTVPLAWETSEGDAGDGELTVRTANGTATRSVTVEQADVDDRSGGGGGGTDGGSGGGPEQNDPPSATGDAYTAVENTSLTVSADEGVLANDNDPDGDVLSAAVENGPANGTLSLVENGSFVYTPNRSFVGTDSFTYQVSDGNGADDTATVAITTMSGTVAWTTPPAFEDETLRLEVGEERTLNVSDARLSVGEIDSYEWSVAGRERSGETTTLAFQEPGEYTVELSVTNAAGQTATTTATVVVETAPSESETSSPPTTVPKTTTAGGDEPAFGIALIGLVVLLGAALLVVWKRS